MSPGSLYFGQYARSVRTPDVPAPPADEALTRAQSVEHPVDVPHFAWPFQRGSRGTVNVVEQGTAAHIMACENFIVRCPLNFRAARPEMGWQFPTFRGLPLDLGGLEIALRTWEPRSRASVEQYADAANAAVRNAYVNVPVEGDF